MIENLSFDELIIWCCKTPEDFLRREIKRVLKVKGFSLEEDNYTSYRSNDQDVDNQLKNSLFVRGNATYCLVAHTDVCRDHSAFENNRSAVSPTPVMKSFGDRIVIQDETEKTQLGGDDRLGVAIALWIACHTNHDIGILLTTDEEAGLLSAYKMKIERVKDFDLLIQIDRGNNSDQIVTFIKDEKLCSEYMAEKLLTICILCDLPREEVKGRGTDVYAIKKNKMCKNAVNMTCGYHDSYGDDGSEFIDYEEAQKTVKLIDNFLKY